MIETWDDQTSRAQNHQPSSLETTGTGRAGGQTFGRRSPRRDDRPGGFGSRPPPPTHRQPVAGSAAKAGLLARRLHALPALGSARGLGAPVEKPASRTLRPSPRFAHRFDDGARPSARRRRAKKNGPDQALGRSRGGFSTKIHAATLDENCAVALHLTAGQAHDGRQFECLYDSLDPDNVLEAAALDKGYDADRIRERLALDGIEPVIPPISTRSKKLSYDKDLYRGRNRVERFFNK